VEKIERRGTEKRGGGRITMEKKGMSERSGSSLRGRLYHHHGKTTLEKLGKDFLATFNSSF